MKILSSAFSANQLIPVKYTCDGENISPPLAFEDIPRATKSLALIFEDPDAPAGLWVHWLVFNILPGIIRVEENSTPSEASVGLNTAGENKYGGPCPPDREHRYFFKLYALDTTLNLPQTADKNELEAAMQGHIIEQAELIGRYLRLKI